MPIRAVNLGGWLVLEKWMTPELFKGTQAEDEYHLLKALGEGAKALILSHRESFITEKDFKWISDYGIDTVRIPVGHWLFDAEWPYIAAKETLDLAFEWARKYHLNIMLDVHAAKGCQNGFDNGGLSGVMNWHKDKKNIDHTLDFIEMLAKTYKEHVALGGIQLLNEPRWDIPLDIIQPFYLEGYQRVRKHCNDDIYVVFHDGFRLEAWESFFKDNAFTNTYLDTHMYQVFSDNDRLRGMSEVIEKVSVKRLNELKKVTPYTRVIVGEFSLGIHERALSEAKDAFTKDALYRAVGNSLLVTFEQVDGWVFWNYTLSKHSTQYNAGWSFKRNVELGYLPSQIRKD